MVRLNNKTALSVRRIAFPVINNWQIQKVKPDIIKKNRGFRKIITFFFIR